MVGPLFLHMVCNLDLNLLLLLLDEVTRDPSSPRFLMLCHCGDSGFSIFFCLCYLVSYTMVNHSSRHELVKTDDFNIFKTYDKFCSLVSTLGKVFSGDFCSQATVMVSLGRNGTASFVNFVYN
jgi:hypothetical protein